MKITYSWHFNIIPVWWCFFRGALLPDGLSNFSSHYQKLHFSQMECDNSNISQCFVYNNRSALLYINPIFSIMCIQLMITFIIVQQGKSVSQGASWSSGSQLCLIVTIRLRISVDLRTTSPLCDTSSEWFLNMRHKAGDIFFLLILEDNHTLKSG